MNKLLYLIQLPFVHKMCIIYNNNNNNNNKIIHISCIQNGSRKLDKIYIKGYVTGLSLVL